MSKHWAEIEVTFEDSPVIEIQPVNRKPVRKKSWLSWARAAG